MKPHRAELWNKLHDVWSRRDKLRASYEAAKRQLDEVDAEINIYESQKAMIRADMQNCKIELDKLDDESKTLVEELEE